MKVAVIGSCLSALVAKQLILSHPQLRAGDIYYHLRSDVLLYLVSGKDGFRLGKNDLTAMVQRLFRNADRNRIRIKMQCAETCGRLIDSIKNSDLILLDPNYDLGRLAFSFKNDGKWTVPYLCRADTLADIGPDVRTLPVLSVVDMQRNWTQILEHISGLNPNGRLVFLNYPATGFAAHDYGGDRVARAEQFARRFDSKHALVVPLIELDKGSLSAKGPLYFATPVYQLIADYMWSALEDDIAPLRAQEIITEAQLKAAVATPAADRPPRHNETNPYRSLPARNFWRTAVADPFMLSIADLYRKKFDISQQDRIATCGSCFAQHIARRLSTAGFNSLDVEPAPADLPAEEARAQGYGVYSARYGNVYTPRQLDELITEAEADRTLSEVWSRDGRYVDPFRPNIFEAGFATPEEVVAARKAHLAAVRRLLREVDVFIFTLGLTEAWMNAKQGYVYPVCPCTTAGRFDPQEHRFVNMGFGVSYSHMAAFRAKLKAINPAARMLLTVSPVPLTATAENRHVLVSTVESKSILRAVAGEMQRNFADVDYFPSYEIVASHPFRGRFYADNLRQVRPEGVDFVMKHFFAEHHPAQAEIAEVVEDDEFCDEAFLELERLKGVRGVA